MEAQEPLEREAELLFRCARVPLAVTDARGAFIDCNAEFTQFSGYNRTDLLELTLFSVASNIDHLVDTLRDLLDTTHEDCLAIDARPHDDRPLLCLGLTLVPASNSKPPDPSFSHIVVYGIRHSEQR